MDGYNEDDNDDQDSIIKQLDLDETIPFGRTSDNDGTSSTQKTIVFDVAENDTISGIGEFIDADIANKPGADSSKGKDLIKKVGLLSKVITFFSLTRTRKKKSVLEEGIGIDIVIIGL